MSAGTDYQYDAFGNLTGRSAFAGSAYQGSFTPDANNQDSTSPYDAAGDLLNDGVNSYSYDAEGRITSVSGATAYQYDAEGRRVAVGPVGQMPTTDYLYDLGGTLVTSVGSDFKMVRSSLYVAGSHWADYTQGTGSGGGRTQYRLGDEVGTLVYTFDQNGNPLEQCLSGPFGEALQCSPSVDYTETHFADKKRDQESNLDYMGARFYSSTLGRFMSPDYSDDPDPIPYADTSNPQTLNRYSYVLNNPLSSSDPDGHDCIYGDGNGGGYVQRGDCTSDTDSGVFVNGTVDVNSFQYNSSKNSSSYTYTPDGGGLGTGVLQGPTLNSGGFEPGSLAAGLFGPQGAKYFGPASGVVNGLGSLELSIMAPGAAALASCTTGGSAGGCGVGMAMAFFPELKGIGLLAKEETAIAGVLKQIASGTTKGKAFENFAAGLPAQAPGYYREFTVPLAGQSGRGAARLVTGAGGEVYYTPDHYGTFTRIK